MGIHSLSEIRDLFRPLGVRTLFLKELATKQDNEKNQIVLGQEVAELTTVLPGILTSRAPSQSELKRKSDLGRPITEATLIFHWIDWAGETFHAPGTRLIDYFQYPEARMSGFLSKCKWAPDAIRRDKQAKFGKRILFLGADPAGAVYGFLLTELEDPLVKVFPDLPASGVTNILRSLIVDAEGTKSPADMLATRLSAVVDSGWHKSVRNKDGEIIPFSGNQGAGYTLEALLGVQTNASKEPDILGHELKSFRGSKLSLMTPTADGGPEGDMSFRDFMDRYGWPGKSNDGSIRFTGVVKCGKVNAGSGLTLRVAGFDAEQDNFSTNPQDVKIEQFHKETGEIVSSWSFDKLATGWNRKHAFAAYIHAEAENGGKARYRYLKPFYMCGGTSVWRFLRAVASGLVYYDPAHAIYADGEAKQRPQWRVGTSDFEHKLRELYDTVDVIE